MILSVDFTPTPYHFIYYGVVGGAVRRKDFINKNNIFKDLWVTNDMYPPIGF